MKINRNLNLVMEVDNGDSKIFVHSMPISRQVFDTYYLPISKAFSAIYSQGLHTAAGPRVAKNLLRSAAIDIDMWEGPEGVENGLFNEIRRLTNVLVPVSGKGWETMVMDQAIKAGVIDDEQIIEIENCITFFIVASAMHMAKDREAILKGAGQIWGWQISSLNCTEFARSLPILTDAENSGETAPASSIPH